MASPDAAATRSGRESVAVVEESVDGRRRRRSTARKTIGRTFRVLLFLFVLLQFGLPQIGGARRALHQLSRVNPVLLGAGLVLQVAALVAYSYLTRAALPRDSWPKGHVLVRIQLA